MEKVYNGIVIFGEMGAGKDALAEQFTSLRKNSKIYNMGVLCREMMKVSKINPSWRDKERYIGQTTADKLREMDVNIMCDYILALIYESGQNMYGFNLSGFEGENYNKELLRQLSLIRNHELSIIVGGRTISDFNYFNNKGYLIIGISISNEVRRKRLVLRDGENTVNASSSLHNTEVDATYIVNNLCHEIIVNHGTILDLKNMAENILKKYEF
ncbi:MAG: hypothetical protein H7Y18_12425 [Clostridiaceae bacterium]|nr:hypothetical protein [Clostridiaceae bacterium]